MSIRTLTFLGATGIESSQPKTIVKPNIVPGVDVAPSVDTANSLERLIGQLELTFSLTGRGRVEAELIDQAGDVTAATTSNVITGTGRHAVTIFIQNDTTPPAEGVSSSSTLASLAHPTVANYATGKMRIRAMGRLDIFNYSAKIAKQVGATTTFFEALSGCIVGNGLIELEISFTYSDV